MSVQKLRLRAVMLLMTLLLGLSTATSLSALEFEVIMVPKVIVVNGIPTVRMVPRLQAIPLPPGILPGLQIVDEKIWDESAVRKVLHVFAFGSHATDEQIKTWAFMSPHLAIEEMLNFDDHNLRLSPASPLDSDQIATRPTTLRALADFWASNDPANTVPEDRRPRFNVNDWGGTYYTWTQMAATRGANPFRERIGFWEANFHLAINQSAGVSSWQVFRYYDDIMAQHKLGGPYQDLITKQSLSAAIGSLYGYVYDRYYDGVCYCNEDFAREYHQLGFGILGVGDTEYHELTTIKNTAKALTGANFQQIEAPNIWEAETLSFGTEGHPDHAVEILHQNITGTTGVDKISALSDIAINEQESLDNLPLMIIQGIADDYIDENEAAGLREAWASMAEKDFLKFIQAYAVSTLFHSPNRIKQWTSLERYLMIVNRFTHSNLESYNDTTQVGRLFWEEEIRPFFPLHNVFGHQTGEEAAKSSEIFRKHISSRTESGYWFNAPAYDFDGVIYLKDWASNMPKDVTNQYTVAHAAEWLWIRFITDTKNYGPLEKAHLYALLATGQDLSRQVYPSEPGRRVTLAELENDPVVMATVDALGAQIMALESSVANDRQKANERIGQAVNFIVSTPFMLAQEGR